MSRSSHSEPTVDTDVVGARAIAQIVDYVCVFGAMLLFVLSWAYVWVEVLGQSASESPAIVAVLSIGFCYNVATEELWNGQTVGKRLVDIRVRSDRGGRASLQQVVLRNLPALIWANGLIYLVGLLAAAVDDREQRLFDKVAGTVVVDTE